MALCDSLGKSMNRKFCFLSDEDGHWYLVPVEKKELFDTLLYNEEDETKFIDEFDDCCLSMHISNYSFMFPSEIDDEKES